jgi:hypothetical protein
MNIIPLFGFLITTNHEINLPGLKAKIPLYKSKRKQSLIGSSFSPVYRLSPGLKASGLFAWFINFICCSPPLISIKFQDISSIIPVHQTQ